MHFQGGGGATHNAARYSYRDYIASTKQFGMPSIIIQAKCLIPFVSVLVALIIVIENNYFSPMILRPSKDGHVHMRVMSNVNSMASGRAKIDFYISLPFSCGFQRIRADFTRMGS